MKSIVLPIFLFCLINLILAKEESKNKTYSSLLFPIYIGQNNTNIKMLFNTFTTEQTLYSNANRKYAVKINEKRNHSYITESIAINEVILPNIDFNLKIDPTDFNDQEIQGELGLGINLEGRNDLINLLYNNKIIFQKEIIIGAQTILDTYLVTDKYYFANMTDKHDLPNKYHDSWIVEQSHILTGTSKKELMWNNSEEINARAVLDSSSKYIYIPIGYLNLFLDIWNLNMTKCPVIEDGKKIKYIRCSNTYKEYFKNIKPIYFIFEGYALLFPAVDLFENVGENEFESVIRFREENYDIWTFGLPLFNKYKVWFKYDKKMVGFNAENVLDFNKEYILWRKENENILNKKSNDKKIVIIGAVLGSMILLTILFCLIKSFRTENSRRTNKFIEEIEKNIPQ
jgi:hypothetical protein